MTNPIQQHVPVENVSLLIHDEPGRGNDDDNSETEWEKPKLAQIIRTASRCLTKDERRIQRLNTELLSSVENGDLELFHTCLRKGANINATCRSSKLTACHAAVYFDNCHMLQEILKEGADLSPLPSSGCTPIHLAAWKGCLTCLKTIISHQPSSVSASVTSIENSLDLSVNLAELDSWDHLHELQNSEVPFIAEGSTALHIACRQLHAECVEYLLHNNADTEALDCYGRSALDMVVKTVETINHCSTIHEQGELDRSKLLDSSMELMDEFDPNTTPVGTSQYEKISEFIIFLLVNYAATRDIFEPALKDSRTDWRSTFLLHSAVIMKNEKLLKFLLNRNVDLELRNSFGDTPLHLAVRSGSKYMLEIFVEMEKTEKMLELKDGEGRTPLLIAAETSWNYGANLLLEVGANVTAITDKGDNILHLATKTNNAELLKELLTFPEIRQIMNYKNVSSETALMIAVLHDSRQCVNELLAAGADYRLCGENSHTIAHMAAEKGHEEILESILRFDSTLISTKSKFDEIPLHLAIAGGHLGCVKILLRRDSPTRINTHLASKNFFGYDPSHVHSIAFSGAALHYAVVKDRLDIVECLINHDSGLVHVANDATWYPLHTAVHFNRTECAEYIIKHGGNLSHEIPYFNNDLRSVFDVLCYSFHEPVSFLERIWDSCIECKNEYLSQECSVSLNYSVLRPVSSQSNQMTVLRSLLKCDNENLKHSLLAHPLTQTFLYFKWRRFGNFFCSFMLLMHLALACSLVSLAVITNNMNEMGTITTISALVTLSALIPLAMTVFLVVKLRSSTINDGKAWLQLPTYMLSLMIGLYGLFFIHNSESKFLMWMYFLLVSVLLAWLLVLFLLIPSIPACGVFILILLRGITNTIKVIGTFFCILCLLIVSYTVLFSKLRTTSDLVGAVYKNISNTIWRLENYLRIHECSNFTCDSAFDMADRFVVFVLAVAFLTVIISSSVKEIAFISTHGWCEVLAEQIKILYLAETYMYDGDFLSWVPKKLKKIIEKKRDLPNVLNISLESCKDVSFKKYIPALRIKILQKKIRN